jgi:hypothetical protein
VERQSFPFLFFFLSATIMPRVFPGPRIFSKHFASLRRKKAAFCSFAAASFATLSFYFLFFGVFCYHFCVLLLFFLV